MPTVTALTVNCEQLRRDDVLRILEQILYEFPVTAVEFYCPKWVEMLPNEDPMRKELIEKVRKIMEDKDKLRDFAGGEPVIDSIYLSRCRLDQMGLSDGIIKIVMEPSEEYYYQMLTDMVGEEVRDAGELMEKLKSYKKMKKEYEKVQGAMESVRFGGYGVVIPEKDEITLEEPSIIKQGNKYGVKIKATSPSIHMIRANVETEIAPIVGSKEQAEDLMGFIRTELGAS